MISIYLPSIQPWRRGLEPGTFFPATAPGPIYSSRRNSGGQLQAKPPSSSPSQLYPITNSYMRVKTVTFDAFPALFILFNLTEHHTQ
jgi:hypothetical protein